MDRFKDSLTDARQYFSEELRTILTKNHYLTHEKSLEYLVDLLIHYMNSENFFSQDESGKMRVPVIAELYAQYLSGTAANKHHTLKQMGDVCLMITGVFPDSLNKKIVDVDYYLGMGGTAYQHLSELQLTAISRTLFKELSEKFKLFSEVLSEMSEKSGLQSNSNLLRVYEKWLQTGSERLKNVLGEHGIAAPIKIDPKVKH
jgi:hypothetical protein